MRILVWIIGLWIIGACVNAGLPPTTSKISGDTSDLTTFKYRFPNFTGTHTGTTVSLDTLSVVGGGTGQTSYTDGQLLIGNTTGNTLNKSTLTAGTGISITNGSGTITIAATGGSSGSAWTFAGSVDVSSCANVWSSSTSGYNSFSTQTGCSYTVTDGSDTNSTVTAPATNIPGFRLAGPAASYIVLYSGGIGTTTGGQICLYRISDGTNVSNELMPIWIQSVGSNNQDAGNATWTIKEASSFGTTTFQVQTKPDGGTCGIFGGGGTVNGRFDIYYYTP